MKKLFLKKLFTTGIFLLTFILVFSFTTAFAGGAAISSFTPPIFARHTTLTNIGQAFMDLNKHDLTMAKGKTATLKAFLNPSGKSIKVEWKSSNPKIAKVSSAGKVTAVAPGTAIIRIFSNTYEPTYDQFGFSDECYVTVQGSSKDAQPLGTGDRTYSYEKNTFQAPTSKYPEALTLVKKSIGGNAYYDDSEEYVYYNGLMFGSKDYNKAHTDIYITGTYDGYWYGFGVIARGKSPIKTSRGIAIETKKSVVQQKYGLPAIAAYDSEDGNYEILSYHSKVAGKNLYTKMTFLILKSKGTVSMIFFYIGA